MEKPLREAKVLIKYHDTYTKTNAVVRLFTSRLEVDEPFKEVKKYLLEKIVNIFGYANGFSFVYDGLHANIEITPANTEDKQVLKGWTAIIDLYNQRRSVMKAHPHLLTEATEKVEGLYCGECKREIKQCHFSCEFCNGVIMCYLCNYTHRNGFDNRRKSKYHPHVLSKFYSHTRCDTATYLEISQSNCGICNAVIDKTKSIYGCYECLKYAECETCSVEQFRGDTATLDVDVLSNILKCDETLHEYALLAHDDTLCPNNMNVVTPGYMDLTELHDKPLDDAYFEVTFLAFNSEEKVGILLTTERQSQAKLFGSEATVYMNDGTLYYSSFRNPLATVNQIQPGDTVGMGLLLDSYHTTRLFVTHNGVLQNSATPKSENKKYSLGVCFTKHSAVRFKTQLRGPYLFDLKSIPDYRSVRTNILEQVPREIPLLLLSWMARIPEELVLLRQVCKTWLKYTNDNYIWKTLFLRKWPLQNPNLPIASWKKFYRSRLDQMQPSSHNFLHPIENCSKHDDCPLFWQKLPAGQNKHERHCDKCDRTVYSGHKRQFEAYKADGRRVCLIPRKSVGFNQTVVVLGEEQAKKLQQQ
eukprot:TRINITY_DN14103_c0_g1_i1.p1 TRINITY_DN14103_c0_g1~~TRINITY_DN14103_c0_g1_i1.p1  ORF type:complete len:585 (-),score=34.51 TRINITY_DN14103_c0_g1_i1:244-1998(-)